MKNMKRIIALLLAVVMLFALAACTPKQEQKHEADQQQGDEPKTVKVGIAAPDVTHGWVAGVAYYAEKYCKDNNMEYKITTSADAAAMTANLQDLMTWGATVIVSWPQWTGIYRDLQQSGCCER